MPCLTLGYNTCSCTRVCFTINCFTRATENIVTLVESRHGGNIQPSQKHISLQIVKNHMTLASCPVCTCVRVCVCVLPFVRELRWCQGEERAGMAKTFQRRERKLVWRDGRGRPGIRAVQLTAVWHLKETAGHLRWCCISAASSDCLWCTWVSLTGFLHRH